MNCHLLLVAVVILAMPAGARQVGVQKQQSETFALEGRVVQEPDGQPAKKVNIQFIGISGPNRGQHTAVTDADGRFAVQDLKGGRYMVAIERAGLVLAARERTTMTVFQNETNLVFHMQAAAVITGKVTDADGDPVRYVSVTANRVGARQSFRTHDLGNGSTDDRGEFRIPDLRPGQYTVVASPPQGLGAELADDSAKKKGQTIYATTYYPGTVNKDQSVAVDVQSGSETPVNITLLTTKAYRIAGDVTGVPAKSLAATMMLMSGQGLESEQNLHDGGKFEFASVVPGTYRARVIVISGFGDAGEPSVHMMDVDGPVEVVDRDIDELHLQARKGGTLRGRFRMDTGEKFDWTQLTVFAMREVEEGQTNVSVGSGFDRPTFSVIKMDGTFEMKDVPSGTYHLVVGAKSSSDKLRDYYTKSVLLDGRDVGDSGFRVTGDSSIEVVISAKGATIEGTVTDASGKPVPYATVADIPNPERRLRADLYEQDTTDERGHFILRGLNPGAYTVLAFEDVPGNLRDPDLLKSYDSRGERLQLDEGSHQNLTLKIIPADTQ